jgi:hypothetical protein
MNKLLITALLSSVIFASDEIDGLLTQVINSGGLTSYYNAPFIIKHASYTNGGLAVTFPEGFFVETPYVFVSLIYPSDDNPGYTWTAYNRSETGITIKVYDSTGSEVANDAVEVDIFATAADPDGQSVLVNGTMATLALAPTKSVNSTHTHTGPITHPHPSHPQKR